MGCKAALCAAQMLPGLVGTLRNIHALQCSTSPCLHPEGQSPTDLPRKFGPVWAGPNHAGLVMLQPLDDGWHALCCLHAECYQSPGLVLWHGPIQNQPAWCGDTHVTGQHGSCSRTQGASAPMAPGGTLPPQQGQRGTAGLACPAGGRQQTQCMRRQEGLLLPAPVTLEGDLLIEHCTTRGQGQPHAKMRKCHACRSSLKLL